MREFLLNSEELLDRNALAFLENGEIWGLLPCHCVRFNEKVKLAYFTEGYTCLGRQIPHMSLDEICFVEQKLLDRIRMLEGRMEISLENLVWDVDGIYLDGQERVFCLCLPAVVPESSLTSQIYLKRVYALLEEMVEHIPGGDEVCRQIEFQKEKDFGNWQSLKEALMRRAPMEDETLTLKSVNTPQRPEFSGGPCRVYHRFRPGAGGRLDSGGEYGKPPARCGGMERYLLLRNGSWQCQRNLSERPADRAYGANTYRKGSILKFADCTFSVE